MLVGRGGAGSGLPRTLDHPSAPLSAQRGNIRCSNTRVHKHQQHRPSLISMLVGRGGAGSGLPRTPDLPSAPLSAQRGTIRCSIH
ncbi:Rieske [2Fe-2S] domain protein [Operophtera brumata]|uniref:Rieske [2Fe-2S] domain protein n=1 Tax=Operophtera brumata TaxID=104452 RepID=A0A0L7KST3_OPEBR|nr:Rieske [2Fe-2S] domain protein [Operophtera brumata]